MIGCGWQAESQLAAIRAAVPTIERAVVWCRTPERLARFCEANGAQPAEGAHEAAACDIVVASEDAIFAIDQCDLGVGAPQVNADGEIHWTLGPSATGGRETMRSERMGGFMARSESRR